LEKTCFIEGIDPKLYKEFKSACAYYELSIKEVLIKHMQNIVDDYNSTLINRTFEAHQKRKGGKKK